MALPWTLPNPSKKTHGAFRCETCHVKEPEVTRRVMRCGYLPRETWGPKPLQIRLGPEPYKLDVCPGWTVRQEGVREAREAYEASEAGVLDRFDPLGLQIVYEGVMLAKRAFGIHTAEQLDKPGRP